MSNHDARIAIDAWQRGRRRRTITGTVERIADAVMAAGAVLLANAALPMRMGLPEGRFGMALGALLLCAGLAWISRHRAASARFNRASTYRMPVPVPVHSMSAQGLRRAA